MRKPKIIMQILKEDEGYSTYSIITTESVSYEELKANVPEAVTLTFEEKEFIYTLGEFHFELDLSSFFDFYKVINAKGLN